MRVLILNSDYRKFLEWLYGTETGLSQMSYEEQLAARTDSLFGVADFYSRNLGACGVEARELHSNNESMQKSWAREHGLDFGQSPRRPTTPGLVGKALARLGGPWGRSSDWFLPILAAQIRHFRPDVLLNQDVYKIPGHFLAQFTDTVRLVVGQIASPLPPHGDFTGYDLMVSSMPHIVQQFRDMGLPAELNKLAFDPIVLDRMAVTERLDPVVFVGNFSAHHASRNALLEFLCRHTEVDVWGLGLDSLAANSAIRSRFKGPAWGRDMYRLLGQARIALNGHIDMAGDHANNCRLFEATGSGAMLLTDWKSDLHEMFEPGTEVAAYHDKEECLELIEHHLSHDDARQAIAREGQRRTLADHTYGARMQELAQIFERSL